MKSRLLIASFALSALAGCNAGDAVVGGHCRAGFTEANGACSRHEAESESGSDSPGFANGTATLLSNDQGSDPSTDPSSASSIGTGPGGGAASESRTNAPDASTAQNTDASAPLVCEGSLVACHGECIPVSNDAANCGACGKICPSNICIDGECQGALAGDVIVLGQDSSSPHAKMLANAFSIPTTDPIRVLAFDGARVNAATERAIIASTIRFRSVAYTVATGADLEATDLARRFDIVLIHDAGEGASDLGTRTHDSLGTFTKKGGIVVAVDDGASDIPAFLRDSGLLAMEGHEILAPSTQVVITAPNDALGVQVLSPYAPSRATVGFLGVSTAADVTIVARTNDESARPTAVHRFVR